jgi:hypothetical protein
VRLIVPIPDHVLGQHVVVAGRAVVERRGGGGIAEQFASSIRHDLVGEALAEFIRVLWCLEFSFFVHISTPIGYRYVLNIAFVAGRRLEAASKQPMAVRTMGLILLIPGNVLRQHVVVAGRAVVDRRFNKRITE